MNFADFNYMCMLVKNQLSHESNVSLFQVLLILSDIFINFNRMINFDKEAIKSGI